MPSDLAHLDRLTPRTRSLWLAIGLCASSLAYLHFAPAHADELGAIPLANDADGDQIVNTVDIDDDNDGIPDALEIARNGADRDSDSDGVVDRLDLDSDNDGILDWQESGAVKSLNLSSLRKVGGRLVGEVGENGLLDIFESPLDTGRLAYSLTNTDVNQDDIPDVLDLDSDNDGWPDLSEAGVARAYDLDRDGRMDVVLSGVGSDGIADYLQQINDRACCDINGDGTDDIIPINTDQADLPDFQDLDSDNDGIRDILELGGIDVDDDGYVDNFVDFVGGPDGIDDGLLSFAYRPQDDDANGVFDHIDFVSSVDNQNASSVDPEALNPQQDLLNDSEDGAVLTGLSASGCSMGTASDSAFLLMLTLLSFVALLWRALERRKLRGRQPI